MKTMEEIKERILAKQDLTDEERIFFAIDEFYEILKTLSDDDPDKYRFIVLIRNNIINMNLTYLKKFNNPLILKKFYKELKKAKENARNNGRINKYKQFMNEIRVVQDFRGVEEIIINELANYYFEQWENWELKHAK